MSRDETKTPPSIEVTLPARRIAAAWEKFNEMVMAAGALDETHRRLARYAFFAGAFLVFNTLATATSAGTEATAADIQILDDFNTELTEHIAGLTELGAPSRS